MHLQDGTLLRGGSYKIIRFIASGGFGCTYEAVQTYLNRKVAIKEFFPKTFCNRESDSKNVTVGTLSQKPLVDKLKNKFIDEAVFISRLSHPGIVKVSDIFEENGTAYYVMEYIEGMSLGDLVDQRGSLPEKEALGYILQVCDALEYVHNQNRLHLDIKPGNIMIDGNGRAVLIDFGLSKQYDEENGENTSSLLGKTPGYAPLEQLGNDVSRFKPATDIYALGATFYKCLTGITPLEANLLADGEPLKPLPNNVSDKTRKAIEKAMMVGSKNRPQTIQEFKELLGANKTNSTSKSGSSGTTTEGPKFPSPVKSNSLLTKVIIGFLVLVSIGIICLVYRLFFGQSENEAQNKTDGFEVELITDSISSSSDLANNQTKSGSKDIVSDSNNSSNNKNQKDEAEDESIPTFQIVAPTNVKVGEEFKVVYQLSDKQRVDIKVKDIDGCVKVSGPTVSETKKGVEYTYTYKAEKKGEYTIPSASVNVNGKIIASNTQSISIQSDGPGFTLEKVTTTPGDRNDNGQHQQRTTLPASTVGKINGHDYVDLGLPSGTKWATCNVGASTPYEAGIYFAWGEARQHRPFDEENCMAQDKSMAYLCNHDFVNNNGNLLPSHDAARQNWGGTWRMPTRNEVIELIDNTTSEWKMVNGVIGRLVTSKKNGQTIFFRAAGWWLGSELKYSGELGIYWCSTLEDNNKDAYGLSFTNRAFNCKAYARFIGRSIRPVSK